MHTTKNHRPYDFYFKVGADPIQYGFVEEPDGFRFQYEGQNSRLFIDAKTRKIHCNGISSALMAILVHMASDGNVDVVEEIR